VAERKKIPTDVILAVLTEAGYRCGVPTCRAILAIDLHHLNQVKDGGDNSISNLIALCPTCHALFHRGEFKRESLFVWKATLVSLSQAFDKDAIDDLLFVALPSTRTLLVSGDGVLKFSRLISAGLVRTTQKDRQMGVQFYALSLTEKAEQFISAWQSGNRTLLNESMKPSSPTLIGEFIQTWAQVEVKLRSLSGSSMDFVPPSRIIHALNAAGRLGGISVSKLLLLSQTRNAIVHGGSVEAGCGVSAELVLELKGILQELDALS